MTKRYRLFIPLLLVFGFLLYIALPKLVAVPEEESSLLSLGPSGDYLEAPGKLVVARASTTTAKRRPSAWTSTPSASNPPLF